MATAPPPSYNDVTKANYGDPNYNAGYQNQPPYPQQVNQPPYPQQVNQPPYPQQAIYSYPGHEPQPNYQPSGDIPESYTTENFASFSDKSIRRAFIRKVYLILTAQLLVTCVFISVFQFVEPIKVWVRRNSWFYYMSYAVFIVTYIALVCCPSVRRRYPGNFIALAVFTCAFSYMTATIATFYDTPAVLAAAGMTAILCLSITIFAIQTKIDFTMCSGAILVLSVVLLLTGLTCGILYKVYPHHGTALHGLYAGLAILVFGMYLIYDTQLVVGGRNAELHPEDYIEGALQLYLDIVYLFLMIMSLFGNKN